MKLLTQSEIEEWCKAAGITFLKHGQACFDGVRSYAVHTPIPASVDQQYGLFYEIFDFWGPDSDYVILMEDWNVFGHDGGMVEILRTFRAARAGSEDIAERPGHWFDANERELAFGLARIVSTFEWGGTFFSTKNRYIIWKISDERLILQAKEEQFWTK